MVPIIISIGFCIICGIICSVIAREKNRDNVIWFIVGFLTDIIGIIIIACLGNNTDNQNSIATSQKPVNKKIAIICDKCGNQFIIDGKSLENIDIIVCSKCKNEIDLTKKDNKKEDESLHIEKELEDDNFIIVDCPKCNEELSFPKELLKDNNEYECPYCKTKITID